MTQTVTNMYFYFSEYDRMETMAAHAVAPRDRAPPVWRRQLSAPRGDAAPLSVFFTTRCDTFSISSSSLTFSRYFPSSGEATKQVKPRAQCLQVPALSARPPWPPSGVGVTPPSAGRRDRTATHAAPPETPPPPAVPRAQVAVSRSGGEPV